MALRKVAAGVAHRVAHAPTALAPCTLGLETQLWKGFSTDEQKFAGQSGRTAGVPEEQRGREVRKLTSEYRSPKKDCCSLYWIKPGRELKPMGCQGSP
eukprot:scaffold7791_cov457-Prasinococcus_capsulatus_cf.AAC.4